MSKLLTNQIFLAQKEKEEKQNETDSNPKNITIEDKNILKSTSIQEESKEPSDPHQTEKPEHIYEENTKEYCHER